MAGQLGAEFADGFFLDLPDAFAGDAELGADLFERERLDVVEAEAEAEHFGLAFVDLVEHLADGGEFVGVEDCLFGSRGVGVFEHFVEGITVLVLGALRARGHGPHGLLDDADLPGGEFHFLGEFVVGGRTAEALSQGTLGGLPAGDHLDHVGGDVYRLDGVDQRPLDGLFDPPTAVGTEPIALLGVEALDGSQQAEVALLDQIAEAQTASGEFLGDVDDQA